MFCPARILLILTVSLVPAIKSFTGALQYRSDRLEEMGAMLGESNLTAIPDGEQYAALKWKGKPISVIKRNGVVEHIGYSFFTPTQRSMLGALICNFLERYVLETDMELGPKKEVNVKLSEDGISFPSGSISRLNTLSLDTTQNLSVDRLDSRRYLFRWNGGTMIFPADAELIYGRGQVENERRLPDELISAPAPVPPPLSNGLILRQEQNGIMVLEGDSYYTDALCSSQYYRKGADSTLIPVDNPALASETIANMASGVIDADSIMLQVDMSVYGLGHRYFSVPLRAVAGYAQQQGCTPYWGTITMDKDMTEGLLVLRNEEAGFNHILRLEVPYSVLESRQGDVQAKLRPFIPMHNVQYLFEELGK